MHRRQKYRIGRSELNVRMVRRKKDMQLYQHLCNLIKRLKNYVNGKSFITYTIVIFEVEFTALRQDLVHRVRMLPKESFTSPEGRDWVLAELSGWQYKEPTSMEKTSYHMMIELHGLKTTRNIYVAQLMTQLSQELGGETQTNHTSS